MNPLRNILRLTTGELIAKTLGLLAFLFIARTLGVETFGVFEWALAVTSYLILAADCGVELWATRATARGEDPRRLAGRVLPLRLSLAAGVYLALLGLMPRLPDFPGLGRLLPILGLVLFAQAASLKWAFMGQEEMHRVARGLVLTQGVFALGVVAWVRGPDDLVFVGAARFAADLAATLYFGTRFVAIHGRPARPSLAGSGAILRPALTLGAAGALSLMSFNFDSLVIGPLLGASAVGLYSAAYKPIVVALALPVSFFLGLFPVLSRAHREQTGDFERVIRASLRWLAVLALPVGVGGVFLATPLIEVFLGPPYAGAAPVLQILALSAVPTMLRGVFRQSLNAIGRHDLDLRCALVAITVNAILTLTLLPRIGLIGAAIATVAAETVWLVLAQFFYRRLAGSAGLADALAPALAAAAAMAAALWAAGAFPWPVQAGLGLAGYGVTLVALGQWPVLRRALTRDWDG